MAEFQLENILLEGHCYDEVTGSPPRGLQFILGNRRQKDLVDTIVMANLVRIFFFNLVFIDFFRFVNFKISCSGLLPTQSEPRRLGAATSRRQIQGDLSDYHVSSNLNFYRFVK